MSIGNDNNERIQTLLIDQATVGLDDEQRDELADLMSPADESEQDAFMQTAALVQLGMHSIATRESGTESMPANLRRQLMNKAMQGGATETSRAKIVSLADRRAPREQPAANPPKSSRWGNAGWVVAAALAIALVIVGQDRPTPSAAEQRLALIASAPDAVTIPWATSKEPGFESVRGEVVWSDDLQEGYMSLTGLRANNPQVEQYQLWIIDPERSAQPVDGGVFDIPSGSGEVVVPIDAKLPVDKPVAFAITLEQPGGVVVSAGPLLVVTQT